MHGIRPARFAGDFDLPSGYRAIAQNTNAVVIERMPLPAHIIGPENREFFFW